MSYQVRILHSAEKEMDQLPATVHARLSKRILTPEVSGNSVDGKNTGCGLAITASYTLLMTKTILLLSWPSLTGVKFMVKFPLLI